MQQLLESLFMYLGAKPQRPTVIHIQQDDPSWGTWKLCAALLRNEPLALGRHQFPFAQLLEREQEKKIAFPDVALATHDRYL